MRRLAIIVALFATSGCSLLFDPGGVRAAAGRDAGAVPPDLAVAEDLAVPDDLAVALDDLSPPADLESVDLEKPRDLLTPDLRPCVPPLFVGFFDMGSADPFDCDACGCIIDTLDDPASLALKLNHGANATFTEKVVADGGLTFVGTAADVLPTPTNGNQGDYDYYNSTNKFYLDGDFDLEVDYLSQTWPTDAHLQLYVLGPKTDGGFSAFAPEGIVQTFNTGVNQFWFYSDDRTLDIETTALSGTMRVRRTAGKLCASVAGQQEACHSGTSEARAWIQIEAIVSDPSCTSNCNINYKARVSKLRLLHGSLVSKP